MLESTHRVNYLFLIYNHLTYFVNFNKGRYLLRVLGTCDGSERQRGTGSGTCSDIEVPASGSRYLQRDLRTCDGREQQRGTGSGTCSVIRLILNYSKRTNKCKKSIGLVTVCTKLTDLQSPERKPGAFQSIRKLC